MLLGLIVLLAAYERALMGFASMPSARNCSCLAEFLCSWLFPGSGDLSSVAPCFMCALWRESGS